MAIDCDSICLDHCIQNQWGAGQAPQPHEPDALVNKCLSGNFKRRNWCTDVPGQCSRRESHRASSERAARLRRPTLPGLMECLTQWKDRGSMYEMAYQRLQCLFVSNHPGPTKSFTIMRRLDSLSGGSEVSIPVEFSWMPKKDSSV